MTSDAPRDPRQAIPGVDRLLGSTAFRGLLSAHPRPLLAQHTRHVLSRVRAAIEADPVGGVVPTAPEAYARMVERSLEDATLPSLVPVLNATGVVLHTNLGRAPLSERAIRVMGAVAQGYSNLEFDLKPGERGSRYDHCADLLTALTGAEAALVVNNAAGALMLALNTLSAGRDVVVSRGELIEIGGGFRIPEIVERSATRLREVGTTNRTRLADYREAVESGGVGALLKVHRSNFRVLGFTEEASGEDLVGLGRANGLPVVHDLGSGLLLDLEPWGLGGEPTVGESVRAGFDVVLFSGDKLLGGPQSGILVGATDAIARMRKNPLTRALRVDKVTLAGLEATLQSYRDPSLARAEIPVLFMLGLRPSEIEVRAVRLVEAIRAAGVEARTEDDVSVVGGGTLPGAELPTRVVRVSAAGTSANDLAKRLRRGDPPVVGRVDRDEVVLDLRTVLPSQDPALVECVRHALESRSR